MILKPQDVLILLKLVTFSREPWTYQRLAVDLSISQSEAHAGVKRAVAARLMSDGTTAAGRPVLPALAEFLIHGVRYAYPPTRGALTRGMPTGYAFEPLYPSVPAAAARDAKLYELLALVDAIRDGRVRERNLAAKEIEKRLASAPVSHERSEHRVARPHGRSSRRIA